MARGVSQWHRIRSRGATATRPAPGGSRDRVGGGAGAGRHGCGGSVKRWAVGDGSPNGATRPADSWCDRTALQLFTGGRVACQPGFPAPQLVHGRWAREAARASSEGVAGGALARGFVLQADWLLPDCNCPLAVANPSACNTHTHTADHTQSTRSLDACAPAPHPFAPAGIPASGRATPQAEHGNKCSRRAPCHPLAP